MKSNLNKVCKLCGAPISESAARRTQRCKNCAIKERMTKVAEKWASYNVNEPHFCVICGKQIQWDLYKRAQNVQTCSRHCAMLLVQARRKETKEHLEERLLAYIKEQKRYVSLKELRDIFHISDKLIYSRGISCTELNRRACNYVPSNTKTAEQVKEEYKQLLSADSSIGLQEAARKIGVSGDYILSLGLSPSALRKELGLTVGVKWTKEELETKIVTWLKTQPVFCPADKIEEALHISIKSAKKHYAIDIKKLNQLAGHKVKHLSYFEALAQQLLVEAGFKVETQKTFPNCKRQRLLRFDFWLPEYNILIEIDGQQHHGTAFGVDVYEKARESDAIKEAYAVANKLTLLRIDTLPSKTFKERFKLLIAGLTGLPRVSEEVHTDSNCGKLPPDNAEDNPQPSPLMGRFNDYPAKEYSQAAGSGSGLDKEFEI